MNLRGDGGRGDRHVAHTALAHAQQPGLPAARPCVRRGRERDLQCLGCVATAEHLWQVWREYVVSERASHRR
eukprot:scaffold79020_cov72-Phaeocystis_antarctica.AAC.1